ncbi:MAG: ATP-binding protein [Alphaproteobacteria bacterium]|nr:ATP-binding protein [Alphaproteobacteria bacterium]
MSGARPRLLLSWSTGKDSAWALHGLRRSGDFEIAGLMSTTTGEADQSRVTIHGIGLTTLHAQARAVGLPVTEVHLPDPCPNDAYERAMSAFVAQARADGITHIAFGDLFLEDVRRYREEKLAGTGITPVFPLWGKDTRALSGEMIAAGLHARIVSVDLQQLDERFLGREFDTALLDDLPPSCDPCGERGEFHSFCYAGPMFTAPLAIDMGAVRRKAHFAHVEPRALDAVP